MIAGTASRPPFIDRSRWKSTLCTTAGGTQEVMMAGSVECLARRGLLREAVERYVVRHSTIGLDSIHGPRHWRRVERNGLYLCAEEGCDPDIVTLFAYLHDFLRVHDGHDDQHGPRAADFIERRWTETGIEISLVQRRELALACRGHTSSNRPPSRMVAICWDADRLDLRRTGTALELEYFHTDAARCMVRTGDYAAVDGDGACDLSSRRQG